MKYLRLFLTRSATALVTIACVLGIAAISLMLASVLSPRPLVVISALSIGHVLGIGAFVFYLLAIVIDAARAQNARVNKLED